MKHLFALLRAMLLECCYYPKWRVLFQIDRHNHGSCAEGGKMTFVLSGKQFPGAVTSAMGCGRVMDF
jgi:hypothetical protein